MADFSAQEMAEKLLVDGFTPGTPAASELSDPIADTYVVVTLDELRPYELDPRLTKNPRYEEIKASIRERGLDAPPPITRRPGAPHYVIRNGGNTRLAILRELWTETKEERFFRIGCLFRPWPERGEIVSLTGHLAENELHGRLSFIERALGVDKARELYELELGKPLSQSELARRLKQDGYPVPQPHISRMQEAIQYLLPAIPNVLYGGLGRHLVEQLTSLRRAGTRIWEARAAASRQSMDFPSLFQEVLLPFDTAPVAFSVQRVRDELVGQMAELLDMPYDTLAMEILEAENRWQLVTSDPEPRSSTPVPGVVPPTGVAPETDSPTAGLRDPEPPPAGAELAEPSSSRPKQRQSERHQAQSEGEQYPDGDTGVQHATTGVESSDRLASLQRLVAEHLGEATSDAGCVGVKTIPMQADGLYPITDVWYIEPALDEPKRLRIHIEQFAREIAEEAGQSHAIGPSDEGIGFTCDTPPDSSASSFGRALVSLLAALSNPDSAGLKAEGHDDGDLLVHALAPMLQGGSTAHLTTRDSPTRISDAGLIKLFRMLRLARRLVDLESGAAAVRGDSAIPEQ
ncbi:hypothetical protein IPC70_09195 [Pseudomonas aeruginosa]|uniref:ParB family protein n=1 Tax=Pseudomonas aeruginosa TaxID=287 RepID=UPI0010675DC8|nr:ParB family protein [Pseudomonas aeruginosa]TEP82030.1 hypothetical protein IPC70_09195 [Pseudomonas aeruginosa]